MKGRKVYSGKKQSDFHHCYFHGEVECLQVTQDTLPCGKGRVEERAWTRTQSLCPLPWMWTLTRRRHNTYIHIQKLHTHEHIGVYKHIHITYTLHTSIIIRTQHVHAHIYIYIHTCRHITYYPWIYTPWRHHIYAQTCAIHRDMLYTLCSCAHSQRRLMNIETRVHKQVHIHEHICIPMHKQRYIHSHTHSRHINMHAHTTDTCMHKYSYAEPRATKSQRPCLSMGKTHHKVIS